MGFQKPNIDSAYSAIRTSLSEIHSPYNDGWTSSSCKQELYLLKCWLEDEYKNYQPLLEKNYGNKKD